MLETECHICCENSEYQATYECKHQICYKCATRLLYLYNDKKCPICKSDKGKPFFSKNNIDNVRKNKNTDVKLGKSQSKFKFISLEDVSLAVEEVTESLKDCKIEGNTEDSLVVFENKEIKQKVKELLSIKCKECSASFNSKKDLMNHFKNKHAVLLCSTCLENNHQFWYEYATHTPESLGQHRRGQLKEPGFEGHIHCPFCMIWLYNKDTAKSHCYQNHQICTVCDILGQKLQFYKNFSDLETHYRSQHYCCANPVCVKNHCYVYAYKSELCAHSISHHGMEMQLSDISVKKDKDVQVFSLFTKGGLLEPESLYTTGVNILNPLVNEPFFPSFNKVNAAKTKKADLGSVPSFLSRQIIHETDDLKRQRERILNLIVPNFSSGISPIIDKYICNIKPLKEMTSELEETVGKEITLKILQKIPFLQKQKEVSEFAIQYKKELKFPPLKKSTKPLAANPNTKPSLGFKIIDFTKQKK